MEFDWDENKNQENIRRRGISFQRASKIFNGDVLEWEDTRKDYSERRMSTIGRAERRLLRVVYTKRGNKTRIISARKADKDDRQDYYNMFLR